MRYFKGCGEDACFIQNLFHSRIVVSIIIITLASLFFQSSCQRRDEKKGDNIFPANLDIVFDEDLAAPSLFGLDKLRNALIAQGIVLDEKRRIEEVKSPYAIVIGTLENSEIVTSLKTRRELSITDKEESLVVDHLKQDDKNLLVIAGGDDRGLMYALLDVARQVEMLPKGIQIFNEIADVSESPYVPVRSMALFLHNQDNEREWYYSKEFWEEYFGMLATERWNSFNLVFSHQTPYLAPMYPFHVTVEKYPEVKAIGLTDVQREKNLEMLRFISSLAKERGLDFTLSIWQQIAWGIGTHTRAQKSMVSGYSEKNMTDYTYLALKKLLQECPGITGLQLRVNYESGITYEEQTAFFRDAVFRAAKESGRRIMLEPRDIGLLSETLDAAIATELPVRVSNKYWGEHMVFPYHPAKFVWTYSYGDRLKYPRKFDVISQVWSLGSHRLLLWGDPEFVSRFAPSTILWDMVGFEICAPLSQKGFGNDPGAWRIFRDKEREYYRWEFERYWSFYRLFGRLTYNPTMGDEVWTSELSRRFGPEASKAIAEAYRAASQVISLISAAANANYNMGAWPEKDMGGLINYYLNLLPYDRARFSGFQEYVDDFVSGRSSGKTKPEDLAAELDAVAAKTDSALEKAQSLVRGAEKEFWATDMDFRILSGMARYHAQKIRAAIKLGFFYRTGELGHLRQAINHGEDALAIWKELSARADEIYYSNLIFGPGSIGHWKDNIPFVENDLRELKYQEELFSIVQNADYAFDFGPKPKARVTALWSTTYLNDHTVERRFQGVFPNSHYDPALGFGWFEGENLMASEQQNIPGYIWSGARLNDKAEFPGEALLGDFISGSQEAVFGVDLAEGHYQGTVIVTDKSHNQKDHGPMEIIILERFGDRPLLDSTTIRSGQTIIKRFNINMTGERFITFRIKFKADPGANFIVNALTFTRVEPHITHVPIRTAQPDQNLHLTACVTLPPPPNDEHPLTSLGIITSSASTLDVPSDIVRVTLKYTNESGIAYRSLDMQLSETASYSVEIPAKDVKVGEIRYFLEAEDSSGQIIRYPKGKDAPSYFRIDITMDKTAPMVAHSAVGKQRPGQPLVIRAKATDESSIEKILLYYRPTRQTMEYSVISMDRSGYEYVATIPGTVITQEFDLMYYFEAFDVHGNACLYPDPAKEQPYFVVQVIR